MTRESSAVKQTPSVPNELKKNVLITTLDAVYNWGRKWSIWPMGFGLACCAIEMMAAQTARFDMARLGAELMRASPRQADLIIISGTVSKKMAPQIIRLYNQMAEPKYVIAMGACAISGGPFKEGYSVVSGIDKFLPVDVYVPGCPPTPLGLLQGLIKLQEKISAQSVTQVPWYQEGERAEEIQIPLMGPDLIAPQQIHFIRDELERLRTESLSTMEEDGEGTKQAAVTEKPLKLPSWDTAPLEAVSELAARINSAMKTEAVTPEADSLIVSPEHLPRVGTYLRDEADLRFDFLSNVSGVDYLGRNPRFEVVYHVYSITHNRGPVVLKARTSADHPELPSLVSIWPSADLQEREIWDMFGIRFTGHPNLKRLLLWEGFAGHPLRKDWTEPYYEANTKPFKSRWPEGTPQWSEDANPFHRNAQYPLEYPSGIEWDPAQWIPEGEQLVCIDAEEIGSVGIHTDKIMINVGPQHPSTHGVFRMVLTLDGETVVRAEPVIGYLHRSQEKIGERNTWLMNMPYTDRLDYLNPMANNLAYALAVEKLTGTEVAERADYLRVIMAEFNRVFSHMAFVGFYTNELGSAFTPMLYAFKERELILDLFEEACGSRMMVNYMRFGGVANDVSDDWLQRAAYLARERLPRKLDEFQQLLDQNEIFVARSKGVSPMSAEDAVAYGITGPMLRAAGVPYDIRRAEPYSVYDRFDFRIPLGKTGDLYDRYMMRILEAREALRILDQALMQIPAGPILTGKKSWQVKVPAGDAYARIEHPKGELGFYLVSNGTANPWRYRVRPPSLINLTAFSRMCEGFKIADAIAVLGSIDIVLGEVDR
jgi:NADH-quinone oxidoreductase subunit C/D